jgi:hypothetical protein
MQSHRAAFLESLQTMGNFSGVAGSRDENLTINALEVKRSSAARRDIAAKIG